MQINEKLERVLKEFAYEKSRNRNNRPPKDKKQFINHITEVLDEMEEYIDQVVKEHPILNKKNKRNS